MDASNIISIVAILFSMFALLLSYITSSRKYELTSAFREEMLSWHKETVEQLIVLREYLKQGVKLDKVKHLVRLSTLIEQGRFYFPNIDEKDGYGNEKPSAYRGYREVTLEFLILSYDIIQMEDAVNYIEHLSYLQRLFTSKVFEVINPRKYNKLVTKYTMIPLDEGINALDFLSTKPELFFSVYKMRKSKKVNKE